MEYNSDWQKYCHAICHHCPWSLPQIYSKSNVKIRKLKSFEIYRYGLGHFIWDVPKVRSTKTIIDIEL